MSLPLDLHVRRMRGGAQLVGNMHQLGDRRLFAIIALPVAIALYRSPWGSESRDENGV